MGKIPSRSLVFLIFIITVEVVSGVHASQENPNKYRALLPESWARNSAITTVLPTYPEEAVRSGRSGVVHIKLEVSPEGEVVRIKVKPRTDALLRKAVGNAVKQWKFKPWLGLDGLPERVISRLIFRFNLTGGEPHVEMYSPMPDTRTDECLECSNAAREMREWREWNEVSRDEPNP